MGMSNFVCLYLTSFLAVRNIIIGVVNFVMHKEIPINSCELYHEEKKEKEGYFTILHSAVPAKWLAQCNFTIDTKPRQCS